MELAKDSSNFTSLYKQMYFYCNIVYNKKLIFCGNFIVSICKLISNVHIVYCLLSFNIQVFENLAESLLLCLCKLVMDRMISYLPDIRPSCWTECRISGQIRYYFILSDRIPDIQPNVSTRCRISGRILHI